MGFLLYRFLNSEEQTATAKDMMAAQRVPPDQSVSSEDSRVLSLEDEDGFENIDEKVVKSMNEVRNIPWQFRGYRAFQIMSITTAR